METNDAGGSLDDVRRARFAARRTATPWWLSLYGVIGGSAILAFVAVGDTGSNGTRSLIAVAAAALLVCSIIVIRKRRATPSGRGVVGPYGTATIVTVVTAVFVVPGVGQEIGGDPSAVRYAIAFAAALLLLGGGQLLGFYLQRRAEA